MQKKIGPDKVEQEKRVIGPQQSHLETIEPGASTTHVNQRHVAPPISIPRTHEFPPNPRISRTGPA